ncbi:putative bifunctional diguanylate cyclase/phosphodiesterase [Paractinoplanes abujensis]|uniref:Diguanylate cyclase (GGDEF)-like protein n=1 Tax=Paractinoplanes abujensis TaxID=882441 RepID=A0A7W7CMC1_9ACTN|nr:EAL domain-containing protein [Actinoplanes abujensis]MBB4691200.1 diguanylate cyclase (GGDEF)-like protein [Actinoplanes abujensis]
MPEQAGPSRTYGWWLFLLLTGALVLLAPVFGHAGQLCAYSVAGAGGTAAVLTGLRRRRLARPVAWWALAVATAFGTIATAFWAAEAITGSISVAGIGLVDLLYLAAYPALAAGLALLPGRAEISRGAGLTETAIVLCTGVMLAYVLLYDPYVLDRGRALEVPVAGVYPFLDAVLFGMASRLLIVEGKLTRPLALVLVATVLLTVSDVRYFLEVASLDAIAGTTLSTAGWAAALVLIGGAALHPVPDPPAEPPGPITNAWWMLLLHIVTVLVGPASTGYALLREHRMPQHDLGDVGVPLALTAMVSVLLVIRMALATRLAERQATSLTHSLAEQAAMQESIRHMALHDTLTGLPTRHLLEERLAGAAPAGGALMLLDLDGFKDVNDRLGHTVGDRLLVAVAGRLRELLGPGETLARPGGDEFALLLPRIAPGEVDARAEAVLATLRQPVAVTGHTLHVSSSIGVRRLEDGAGVAELLSDADLALYAAKAEGKDRHQVFDPRMRREQAGRIRMVERLREGLEADEFTVHYQPIVTLRGGRSVAFEALVRWTPPGQDPIGPDRFIPAAEDSGLIVCLGEWVLRRACADAAPWFHTYGTTITVNVSPRQLAEHDFADKVRRALDDSGLPGAALTLEITEGVLVRSGAHAELTLAHLTELRSAGVRVAIDDFGTGYSSLAYLRDLPIDFLKIDKSFMPDDPTDAQQGALVRAVVDLARSLRLVTVAEGVETAHHAELLRTLGCDRGQGWLFGRPGTAAAASLRLVSEATVTVRS